MRLGEKLFWKGLNKKLQEAMKVFLYKFPDHSIPEIVFIHINLYTG
jgi:hypothetical protein